MKKNVPELVSKNLYLDALRDCNFLIVKAKKN